MSEQKKNGPALYTAAGAPVANNQDSITAGARGPVLLEDVWLIEKLAHFDREVIPERRMHAKGSGAFGTFTVSSRVTGRCLTRFRHEHGPAAQIGFLNNRIKF